MAEKRQNYMKVTLWTENLKMTFDGTISACVIQAFGSIQKGTSRPAAQVRENALKLMQAEHERLTKEGL